MKRRAQFPAIYTPGGDRLLSMGAVDRATNLQTATPAESILCVMEGGIWIWPPGKCRARPSLCPPPLPLPPSLLPLPRECVRARGCAFLTHLFGVVGKIGSVRSVKLPAGRVAHLKTLALQPVVLEVENFLDPAETMHIKDIAGSHLEKSPVSLKVGRPQQITWWTSLAEHVENKAK